MVYDDCGIISSVTQFPSYDSIFDFIGTDTIQFVVSDNFGNLNTCQFVIDIQNNPMFDCNEIFLYPPYFHLMVTESMMYLI